MAVINGSCDDLRHVSTANFIVSILLTLGIAFSYVPQLIRIYNRRSSEGISPWFLLLAVSSGVCATCNIFLLSAPIFNCIRHGDGNDDTKLTFYEALASLLGLVQITLQAVMALAVLVLCRLAPQEQDVPAETKVVTKVCITHLTLSVLISAYVAINEPKNHIQFLASLMGLTAIALALVQYFPQIYTTFTLKHAGSLSIPMMCMQTPGGFVWAASLALRPGTEWSSWAPFLTAAMLQGTLLLMAVYYEYVGPKVGGMGETAPLLHEQQPEHHA